MARGAFILSRFNFIKDSVAKRSSEFKKKQRNSLFIYLVFIFFYSTKNVVVLS